MIVLAAASGLAPEDRERVRRALESGALLIYPTDTLYAVGGLVRCGDAARAVRAVKGREEAKALPAVAADLEQVRALCPDLGAGALALAGALWPGPLTLVLRAAPDVPREVTAGTGTLAVRVPDRVLTRELCALAGPLVSTSANQAAQAPATTCEEAQAAVAGGVAFAIDAGPGHGLPSTIVDATGGVPRLLRPGAVPWEAVIRAWS
jgi:L-threonylcarbamoyladenylate synthase